MLCVWLSDWSRLSCMSLRRTSNSFSACRFKDRQWISLESANLQLHLWILQEKKRKEKKTLTVGFLWERSLSSLSCRPFSASNARILLWRSSSLERAQPSFLFSWTSGKNKTKMLNYLKYCGLPFWGDLGDYLHIVLYQLVIKQSTYKTQS